MPGMGKRKSSDFNPTLLDARLQGFSGGRRDLELDWALGLVLQDDCSRCDLIPMADVAHLQSDEIAAAQLAVDAQVEQCELTHSVLHLESNSERPDVLEFERGLLPDDLALVPRLTRSLDACVAHDGLPPS